MQMSAGLDQQREMNKLHNSMVPKLEEENQKLSEHNSQLLNELKIVKWYVSVFEAGLDFTELSQINYMQNKKIKALEKRYIKFEAKSKAEIKKLKSALNRTQ